ncbi:glycosyltransferase family 9 protein, partial [Thermodesulfobacteriota bacterium]
TYDRAVVILNRRDRVVENLRGAGIAEVGHSTSSPPPRIHLVEHLHRSLGFLVPPKAPALQWLSPKEGSHEIWVHPGSGGVRKCIPLEVMASLISALRRETGWSIVVTVGEADSFVVNDGAWRELIAQDRVSLVEGFSLSRICEGLGKSGIYVGNDSGISHMAAGLGIPCLVFFTATDPDQWAPWVPGDQLTVVDCRERPASEWSIDELMDHLPLKVLG